MFHASPFYLTSPAHVTKNQCGDFSPFRYKWWVPRPLWMRHSFWSTKVLMPITGRSSFLLWSEYIVRQWSLLGMFLWLVGALWVLQSPASLLLLEREFFSVKKRTRFSSLVWPNSSGFPFLFDQTLQRNAPLRWKQVITGAKRRLRSKHRPFCLFLLLHQVQFHCHCNCYCYYYHLYYNYPNILIYRYINFLSFFYKGPCASWGPARCRGEDYFVFLTDNYCECFVFFSLPIHTRLTRLLTF